MISHLIQYLKNRKQTMFKVNETMKNQNQSADEAYESLSDYEKLIIEDIPQEAPHMNALWVRFCEIEGNESLIDKEIEEAEVATWMSGLVCVQNEMCFNTYTKIVPDDDLSTGNKDGLPRRPAKPSGVCPPNCGCDNPWQNVGSTLQTIADNAQADKAIEDAQAVKVAEVTKDSTPKMIFAIN